MTVAVAVIDGIDEKGNYIYRTKELSLRSYILNKCKTKCRNSELLHSMLEDFSEKVASVASKNFDELVTKFVDSFREEELPAKFDFVGVTSSNYLRAGIEEKDLKNFSRSGKLKKIGIFKSSGFVDNYVFSLNQYARYREDSEYFDKIKNRFQWLSEGREVNYELLKETEDNEKIETSDLKDSEYYDDKVFYEESETHEKTEEENAFYQMEVVKRAIKKQAKKVRLRKSRGK